MIPKLQNEQLTLHNGQELQTPNEKTLVDLPLTTLFDIITHLGEKASEAMDPRSDKIKREMEALAFRKIYIQTATTIFMSFAKNQGFTRADTSSFLRTMLANCLIHACNRNWLSIQEAGVDSYDKLNRLLDNANLSLTVLNSNGMNLQMVEERAVKLAKRCTKIHTIDLPKDLYSDQGVKAMIEGKMIRKIRLFAQKITSESINEIAKHPIEELHLIIAPNLTDQDVDTICSIRSLKRLTLTFPFKISEQGVNQLKARGFEFLELKLN